jgi:xanthine dehydrogenase iron-sulfur cluster and FAD-binding subunit A
MYDNAVKSTKNSDRTSIVRMASGGAKPMKPAAFEYERAATVENALHALAAYGERAKVLAGGQSLIPMLNLRVVQTERLIDIGRLNELKYVKRVGDEIRIGALTTHNAVMTAELVRTACPIIAEAYHQVAHHSVRNRGTMGGSLCHNDPAAEMPLVMHLVNATMVARSATGEREIAAGKFFNGSFSTVLGADELLVFFRPTLKLTISSDTVGMDLGSRNLVAQVESNDKIQLTFKADEFVGEYFHYTGDLFLIDRSGNLARMACQRN